MRRQGRTRRNINMFEKLCGKEALQNVIIATTMWDKAGEEWGSELEEKLFEEKSLGQRSKTGY